MNSIARSKPLALALMLLPATAIAIEDLANTGIVPPACPITGDAAARTVSFGAPAIAVFDPLAPAVMAAPAESTDSIDQAGFRQRELDLLERFVAERPQLDEGAVLSLSLTAAQRGEIEGSPVHDSGRLQVGSAIAVAHRVDFVGATPVSAQPAGAAHRYGRLQRSANAGAIWEIGIRSDDARALRVGFDNLDLADGVRVYVYNDAGRIEGPFTAHGPDDSGHWLSGSVFGDRVRVRLEADSESALHASSLTIGTVVHMGSRFRVADVIRDDYLGRLDPDHPRGTFCGFDVPSCTINGVCAIDTNPSFTNAANGVAHINFMVGASSFICTGTLLNSTGSAPRPPYFLTANHCFSTQASASTLEAIYNYRTTTCAGCTPTPTQSTTGATLLATGASPAQPDFTLVRMHSVPAGRWLQGWNTGQIATGTQVFHLGHPAGAPLTYQLRRLRTSGFGGTCASAPQPTFLYSGLGTAAGDVQGATAGGSSGGAAFVMGSNGPVVVGQLLGSCHSEHLPCNADVSMTVDGALSAAFPQVRRYLYDELFRNGFQSP